MNYAIYERWYTPSGAAVVAQVGRQGYDIGDATATIARWRHEDGGTGALGERDCRLQSDFWLVPL